MVSCTDVWFMLTSLSVATALLYNANPTSDASAEDRNLTKSVDISDESGHEIEILDEDLRDKKFLDEAMQKVLDPTLVIVKNNEMVQSFKQQLKVLDNPNITFESFMDEMDRLSLQVCKISQQALWSYVTDINDEVKKNNMIIIAAEEDKIKKQYWNMLKKNYLNKLLIEDPKLKRKIRIIQERGINVQMPQSKEREEIDTMQKIWSRVFVCVYNVTNCSTEDSMRTMSDIISIFKTSNDSKELAYYWTAYRDATGKKIRPIFRDYAERINNVAIQENFTDAGDMWRYVFENDDFENTVDRIWLEIKPLYDLLQDYVRLKLKEFYSEDLQRPEKYIPAHILGNLWAQEWQAVYPKVVANPEQMHVSNNTIKPIDLFDAVDDFHQSLGFDSARESYQEVKDTVTMTNCLPSSHDMCDGENYKIKWCGEKITNVVVGLSRAARLLGHIQYFRHYRNLPPIFRDGPNPAFHDAISDITAIQVTAPKYLKKRSLGDTPDGSQATLNHLLWVALEKLPLMAYAYVLDKWRWDIFANRTSENWNQHWWDLRMKETGVSAPVPRNESDLDPAAKYHVVSHVQYITYLISHVLEFQILRSLCKAANHTGPLHECSIYGSTEAGKLLSEGMSLGASEDWRTVLKTMTGETELSTEGFLEYFTPLQDYLQRETVKLASLDDMDKSAPIIVGSIVIFMVILIFCLYCVKKHEAVRKMFSVCGLSENGSLDIATNEMSTKNSKEVEGVNEEKV